MPFTKIRGSRKYRSPSGKRYTGRQVKFYYASGRFQKIGTFKYGKGRKPKKY